MDDEDGLTGPSTDASLLNASPSVFISYRRDDTGDVVSTLAGRLEVDLGGSNVFRDVDDLIAGQSWREALERSIINSDATVCLVGSGWAGQRPDGTRRIDRETDAVRREVRLALDDGNRTRPVPVLVDLAQPPDDLPKDVEPLFAHHAVVTSRVEIDQAGSADYQRLLVGIWETLRQQVTNGVLLLSDRNSMAALDELVDELRHGDHINAQELSRFASGAYVLSARRLRRGVKRWPDVVIVADGEPSSVLRARIDAVNEHPIIRNVSFVAVGAAGALAVSELVATVSGAVSFTSSASLSGALPAAGSGPISGVSAAWGNAAVGAKIAAGVSAALVAGAAGVATARLLEEHASADCVDARAGAVVDGVVRTGGDPACFRLDGSAGDVVLVRIAEGAEGDDGGFFLPEMQVLRPDGTVRDDCRDAGAYGAEVVCELDTSGGHLVEIVQNGTADFDGGFDLSWRSLDTPTDCIEAVQQTVVEGEVEARSKSTCFVVSASEGEPILIHTKEGEGGRGLFAGGTRVVNPDGTMREDCVGNGTYDNDLVCEIDATGQYLVLVSQISRYAGPVTLWWTPGDDPASCVNAPVDAVVTETIASTAEGACFVIAAEAGDRVLLRMGGGPANGEIWVVRPDGSVRDDCNKFWGSVGEVECVIDMSGEHVILTSFSNFSRGGEVEMLWRPLDDRTGCRELRSGETWIGSIESPVTWDCFARTVSKGDRVIVTATATDGLLFPQVRVVRPDGTMREDCDGWDREIEVACAIDSDGEHLILLNDIGGRRTGTYTLAIRS